MKRGAAFLMVLVLLLLPGMPRAEAGDPARGRRIYERLCWWCHGEDGFGDGPASEYLSPPPRDLTDGTYKFRSTPFDEFFPGDDDIFRVIKHGLAGTAMPGWGDVLDDDGIWDLVAFLKELAAMEPVGKASVEYGAQPRPGRESIERGRELFEDRCSECHGMRGRGDTSKRLRDDWGFTTWPRNLTKGWTFRAGSTPRDIFRRITTGIPGTQMPSFDDPTSRKRLDIGERWDVANYVASLNAPYKEPKGERLIRAVRVDTDLPETVDDVLWEKAPYTSLYTTAQLVEDERLYMPTIDSLSVKALYNQRELALLVEWDDPTKSVPGDRKARRIAGGEPFRDAMAVEFPVGTDPEEGLPYFGMGESNAPVSIWHWRGESATGPQEISLLYARGPGDTVERSAEDSGLFARGEYRDGTWRVVVKRPLATADPSRDVQFKAGGTVPVAFALWDGSNFDRGSKHVMTGWSWLRLEPEAGRGVFVWSAAVFVAVLVMEIIWMRSMKRG